MDEVNIIGSMGRIYGVLERPEGESPAPLVILSHGFGGSHEGNADYAARFRARGLATFNFDFCGEGSMLEMSVLTEAEDLCAIIDAFKGDALFSRIFLWGASQGGFVSSYVAARRPGDVAALVLEYPAYVLQDDARARANPDGGFPETETVMGQRIGHVYGAAAVSFNIYDVIGAYAGDVLILHGDRDDIVPLDYARRAAKVFPSAELVVMPGQEHVFFGAARSEAMEREAEFFLAHSRPTASEG